MNPMLYLNSPIVPYQNSERLLQITTNYKQTNCFIKNRLKSELLRIQTVEKRTGKERCIN